MIDKQGQEFANKLWDHLDGLYKNSVDDKKNFQKYYDYYLGRFNNPDLYQEVTVTDNSNNVIKQIIDAKLTLMLDNQLITGVAPKSMSFETLQIMDELQAEADVYNDCLKDTQKQNNNKKLKQKVGLWGLVCGMGIVEQTYDPDFGKYGSVRYAVIDPRKVRWEATAQTIDESSSFHIEMEMSPMELKKKYGVNEDGTVNQEMCDKIDQLSGTKDKPQEKKDKKGVISYTSAQGAGQAYAYGQEGIKGIGKSVKLVKTYLKDDSTFMPNETDDADKKTTKEFLKFIYPNGRVILRSIDEKNKIIFEDKPIDYRFGFPIDIWNSTETDKLSGKGEVEDLINIQDRINKAYGRARTLIAKYISILCVDKGQMYDLTEQEFVNQFVAYIDNMNVNGVPQVVTNNTLGEFQNLIEYIKLLKQDAKEIARVNDTILSGMRQPGTTSAAQVDALKEDPMSAIRTLQQGFVEFMIKVSTKTVSLIQDFYSFERIHILTTGMSIQEKDAKYAQFGPEDIKLLDEAGVAISAIKKNKEIEFDVEIVAGTEVPRSRVELAQLTERLYTQGLLGDPNDLDTKEDYLKNIDFPNYRTFINRERKKQEEQSGQTPAQPPVRDLSVSFKDLPLAAQLIWLNNNGFPVKAEDIMPATPLEPAKGNNEEIK